MGIETEMFIGFVEEEFMCLICTLVLDDPVRVNGCEHMFCRKCIDDWLDESATCPVDRSFIDRSDLISPDRTVVSLLNKLKIRCEFKSLGCEEVVQLESWKSHLNECYFNPDNKRPCVGCGKMMTKKDDDSHKGMELLEIEIIDLKKEIEKLKEEISNQNDLIKELIETNEENQETIRNLEFSNEMLTYENEPLKNEKSNSTESLFESCPSVCSNTENCLSDLILEERITTSSIDKWHVLKNLPKNLKCQIRLAVVLGTGQFGSHCCESVFVTENDEIFWVKRNKAFYNKPIKIDRFTYLSNKSLEYAGGFASGSCILALYDFGHLWACSNNGHILIDEAEQSTKFNFVRVDDNLGWVTQLACGNKHALTLNIVGKVFVWGGNDRGQIGVGTTVDQSQPVQVTDKIETLHMVAIACCYASSFAVTYDGDVYSWGNNGWGQLGINNNCDQKTPTKIEDLTEVRRLACGLFHVLAVTENGLMFAWGSNKNGQLGTGDMRNRNKPVKIGPAGVKFVEVAACKSKSDLSVALSEDGRCWVWGKTRTEPNSEIDEFDYVLEPKPVESASIHDAIADYAEFQMTWKTMVIRKTEN